MKSKTFLMTLILTSLLSHAYCDVIPENSHFVDKCVKITNIGEFDNLVILGYILHIGSYHEDTYEVSSSKCLTKGYKFNTLQLFAVKADYIAGKDIDNIDLPNDNEALESNITIDPYDGYINDSIPIDRIEKYYKIIGFTDTSVILFNWQNVYGFNNGATDSIVTFEYNDDNSQYYKNMPTTLNESKSLKLNTHLYPNPSSKLIIAEISNSYIGNVKIQLLSQDGKILTNYTVVKNSDLIKPELSTSQYPHGIYFLKLQFGNATETKKFVIE